MSRGGTHQRRGAASPAQNASAPSIQRLKSPSSTNGTPSRVRSATHALQRRQLLGQRMALASAAGGERIGTAAGFQVQGEHAQRPRSQMQRNVGAAAQVKARGGRVGVERGQIRIGGESDTIANRQPRPLHHLVPGHVQRVAIGRKDPPGHVGAIHLLERDHVGVEDRRVAREPRDILRLLRAHVRAAATDRRRGGP